MNTDHRYRTEDLEQDRIEDAEEAYLAALETGAKRCARFSWPRHPAKTYRCPNLIELGARREFCGRKCQRAVVQQRRRAGGAALMAQGF